MDVTVSVATAGAGSAAAAVSGGLRAAARALLKRAVPKDPDLPLSQTVLDEAFRLANTPDKLTHVIDPPKHGFQNLVTAAGGRSEAMGAIVGSLRPGGLPATGRFEVQRVVYGETVTIRGAIVNGIPRIGTAFVAGGLPG